MGEICFNVPSLLAQESTDTASTCVSTNLILVADWLEDIVIHKSLNRDGDIIEIIPGPWYHKQNLNIFMFKLFFIMLRVIPSSLQLVL